MNLTTLNAISPIDGRYRNKINSLSAYFSEEALIKYRVRIEIEYFIALCEIPLPQLKGFDIDLFPELRKIYNDAFREIESQTNYLIKTFVFPIKESLEKYSFNHDNDGPV